MDNEIINCDKGICSFDKTGKKYCSQRFYLCLTCYPLSDPSNKSKVICESCKKICHKGHQIKYFGLAYGFCDCGYGDCPIKCKCMKKSKSQDNSNISNQHNNINLEKSSSNIIIQENKSNFNEEQPNTNEKKIEIHEFHEIIDTENKENLSKFNIIEMDKNEEEKPKNENEINKEEQQMDEIIQKEENENETEPVELNQNDINKIENENEINQEEIHMIETIHKNENENDKNLAELNQNDIHKIEEKNLKNEQSLFLRSSKSQKSIKKPRIKSPVKPKRFFLYV